MKKVVEYINTLGSFIALLAFFGIISLANLLDKLKFDKTYKFLIYIGITALAVIIAFVILQVILYHTKIKNNKAFLIEKYLDEYIAFEGVHFLEGMKNNNQDKILISRSRQSIKLLSKKGITNTLESDVYYMYLFSLLNGAKKRIWAASIVGEEEWIDTPEEDEFLRLNINAAKKQVLVERIFILKQQKIQPFLENKAIRTFINKRNDYLKTYIIIEENISRERANLLTDIGSGFLAFDDFAIATDVFQDSFIRGILTLEEEAISRNNRIFTNLRDFAIPLDKNFLIQNIS